MRKLSILQKIASVKIVILRHRTQSEIEKDAEGEKMKRPEEFREAYFQRTGSRVKFKEWLEKWDPVPVCPTCGLSNGPPDSLKCDDCGHDL